MTPAALPAAPPPGGHARLVAAGIFLSRIAGLIRDRIFAHYFGTSIYASAFRGSLRMPNVLQNLLGEGTLSASFIPVYAELLERGEKEAAGRLAGAIFALLLGIAGTLALIGLLLAPVLVSIFFPGWDGEIRDVTIACTRIIFPMTGVLVLSAWSLGVLNSHRKFFVSYFAPVLWNAAMITTLLMLGGRLDARSLVVALAWGALVGGVLQFLVQVPWVLRLEKDLDVRWRPRTTAGVTRVIANAGPAILGRGVVQLSGWVDVILASFLFQGAVAALGYAQTLYILPISLFGMSVAAAELPELSRRGRADVAVMAERVRAGLLQIAVFVVPSVVGFLVLGDIIVAALYETGDFVRADTVLVQLVLAGYAVGLFAATATRLYASTYYALQDTRTPAKIALVRVLLGGGLGFTLMVHLEGVIVMDRPLGVVGLSAGAGIAAWIEWWYYRRGLRPLIGKVGAGAGAVLRLFAAALAAALVARGLLLVLPPVHPILRAGASLVPFGLVYFAAARALGVRETEALLRRMLGRFGTRRR